MSPQSPIFVTRSTLPPLEDLIPMLRDIWDSRMLTNGSPFHQRFEAALAEYLGVRYVTLVANATLGLLLALRALDVRGEVVTTPFSFVATAHSLLWSGLTPVFVDIEAETLNVDPERIPEALGEHTGAILPVHCFGRVCDVPALAAVAGRQRVPLIYDAAHAFAVQQDGTSVLRHGTLSVLSFHASKVFNTFEGGAIICDDPELKQRLDRLRNNGIVDENTVESVGLNAKMNEFSAALGILQLERVSADIACRRTIDQSYRKRVDTIPGLRCIGYPAGQTANYGYFPIVVEPEYPLSRDALYQRLHDHQVFARRYFNPLISQMPMYRNFPSAAAANLPVANRIVDQILCLPLYPDLTAAQQQHIIDLLCE